MKQHVGLLGWARGPPGGSFPARQQPDSGRSRQRSFQSRPSRGSGLAARGKTWRAGHGELLEWSESSREFSLSLCWLSEEIQGLYPCVRQTGRGGTLRRQTNALQGGCNICNREHSGTASWIGARPRGVPRSTPPARPTHSNSFQDLNPPKSTLASVYLVPKTTDVGAHPLMFPQIRGVPSRTMRVGNSPF